MVPSAAILSGSTSDNSCSSSSSSGCECDVTADEMLMTSRPEDDDTRLPADDATAADDVTGDAVCDDVMKLLLLSDSYTSINHITHNYSNLSKGKKITSLYTKFKFQPARSLFYQDETSRDRSRSAPYLRLKNSKRTSKCESIELGTPCNFFRKK